MKRIWEDVIDGVGLMVGIAIGTLASEYSWWYLLLTIPTSFLIGMVRGILEAMDSESGLS